MTDADAQQPAASNQPADPDAPAADPSVPAAGPAADNGGVTIERVAEGLANDDSGLPPLTEVKISITLPNGVDLWERSMSTVPDTESRLVDSAQRFVNVLRTATGRPAATITLVEDGQPAPEQP